MQIYDWFCILDMSVKLCNGCKSEKDLSEFWLKYGKPQNRCKDCQKIYHKKHYIDNIEIYKQRGQKRNQQVRKSIRDLIDGFKDTPCQDCKIKYPPYVMDFDHRPEEIKNFNLAKAVWGNTSRECIVKEIQKCDLVCANCHRIRTHNRIISRNTQVV